jgi:hypothetical protein
MNLPDFINGLFESGGALLLLMNIFKLKKDKQVRGFHWLPTSFFASWSIYNLFYYPHLNQMFSLVGAVLMAVFNVIFALMAIYYVRKESNAAKTV